MTKIKYDKVNKGVWVMDSPRYYGGVVWISNYDLVGCNEYWVFAPYEEDIQKYGLETLLPMTLQELWMKYDGLGCSSYGYKREDLSYMLDNELDLSKRDKMIIKRLLHTKR